MASSIYKTVAFECYHLQPAQPGKPEELKLVLFRPADTSATFLNKNVTLYTARDHVCTPTELARIGEKIETLRAKNLCIQSGINLMQLPGLTKALENLVELQEQEPAVQQKGEALKSQDESERKEKAQTGWQQEEWDEKGWEDMAGQSSQKKIPTPEFTMDLDLLKGDLEENYAKLKSSDRQNLSELSKLLTGTFEKALHDNILGTNYLGSLVKLTKALKAYIAKPDSTTSSNLEGQIIALKKLPELAQIDSDKILALTKSRYMKDLVEVYVTEIFARFP